MTDELATQPALLWSDRDPELSGTPGTITGSEGGDIALKTGEAIGTAAATTAATVGIMAAFTAAGSAIPIPGIGTLVGAAIGAIVAGFNALPGALKSKFHPYPEDASAAALVLAHLDPHWFFTSGIDAASNSHDFVRLIRYFRVRTGIAPRGYLGNNFDLAHFRKTGDDQGKLYDPVSSWARVGAGTDCTNGYLCAVDPLDPMTDEGHIQKLMDGGKSAKEIRDPVEARAILKIMRDHLAPLSAAYAKMDAPARAEVQREIAAVRRLAGDKTDPKLDKAFGTIAKPSRAGDRKVAGLSGEPSRTAWFLLGAVATATGIVGLAVHAASPGKRAAALADALVAYADAPSAIQLHRVSQAASFFAASAPGDEMGREAARLATWQARALGERWGAATPAAARRWAAAWRAWRP